MVKRIETLKEFREMKEANLKKFLEEKREKLREMRFNHSAGQLKKVDDIKKTKKDIARILTLLKQKSDANSKTKAVS